VNFLMILLKQMGIMPQPGEQPPPPPHPKHHSSEPGLKYCIQIRHPKIRMFRSSLSEEGFKAVGQLVEVTNFD
jgi:hypothetical protein